MAELTPLHTFGAWHAKREDLAGFSSLERPSGAKVRAYGRMIEALPEGLPLVVGCGASSAIQVYLADAARQYGREAHVAVPARAKRHPSTNWAEAAGARIHEIRPGYPSVVKARARLLCPEPYVHWDARLAALDTAEQVANIPPGSTLVVPTGSGLIAAGIVGGLASAGIPAHVRLVAVGGRGKLSDVWALVAAFFGYEAGGPPGLSVARIDPTGPYNRPVLAELPDGTPLDPYYAAKALPYVGAGDILWVIGRRPAAAW
jgi:hypothetical protein